MLELKYSKLDPSVKNLALGYIGDAGIDLPMQNLEQVSEHGFRIDTGICLEIPENNFGELLFRSGVLKRFAKYRGKNTFITNILSLIKATRKPQPFFYSCAPGAIDCNYRGEIMYYFRSNIDYDTLKKHILTDMPLQIIIKRFTQVRLRRVEKLSENKDRGTKGFGSKDYVFYE